MSICKSIVLCACLTVPMMAGAVTTTSFTGVDTRGTGVVNSTGTGGGVYDSNTSSSPFTNAFSGTGSSLVNLPIGTANSLPIVGAVNAFSDTWTLNVGTGEVASIIFDKLNTTITTFGVLQTSGQGGSIASPLTLNDLYTWNGLLPGSHVFTVAGTYNNNATSGQYKVNTNVVSTVPIPAAIWLMGSAVMGLVGFGKRKAVLAA